jgi:hypothetical protein
MRVFCQIQDLTGGNDGKRRIFLYTYDKHTPESHAAETLARGLTLPQKEAVQTAVRMHPMASATNVRRSLHLVE